MRIFPLFLRANQGCGIALLALLVFLAPSVVLAQDSGNTIVFYADKQVGDGLWAPLFGAVQEDLAKEDFGSASQFLDRNPRLLRSNEVLAGEEFGHVVQVKLLGRCDVVQQAYRPLKPGPLGWVLRVQGEIQPYIYIDCTRMAQTLNATTLGMSNDARMRAMTQAMAHVLVHEWIHIATQNGGHTAHGISQAQLSVNELVSETTEPPHASREADSPKTTTSADVISIPAEN